MKMQIQIMFFFVCILCRTSRGKVNVLDEEQEGLLNSETKIYTEVEEHIKTLKKLLLELENTRDKTQSCKLVFLQFKISEETSLGIIRSLILKVKKLWKTQQNTSHDEMLLMLSCLEHLMNDFENAHEFEKLNGIQDILFPALNSTLPALKVEAAHLLASAALLSPRVQITALESGVIALLLKSVVRESNLFVRINSMHAVTCILKNYPQAQAKFVNVGGLKVLAKLVETPFENHQLLIKTISMLHELVEEHKSAIKSYTKKDMRIHHIYQEVGFEKAILDQGWCLRIARLLMAPGDSTYYTYREMSVTPSLPVRRELDLVEKVCETLLALVDTCRYQFVNIQLKKVSKDLNILFHELITQTYEHKHLVNETMKVRYSRITDLFGQLTRELEKLSKRDEF